MPDSVNNIHDKFVRESFSDPARAMAFFERFLPEDMLRYIELSSLKVLQESYMNEGLQEHFSDLVFEVALKNHVDVKADLVLLFEHKSYPDRHVLIQVGHYMFSHWVKCLAEKKKLKVIIPVIYYQGKQEWKLADLPTLFNDYPVYIRDFVPELRHLFFALNTISEDKIETMRNTMMAAAVIAQKWRINPVKLQADFERIFKLFPLEGANLNFLEIIVVYALNVSDISEEVLAETIKSIPPSIKDNIMTTYTRLLQKGEQIGIQKGEQIGIQKGEQIGIQKGEQIGIQKGEQIGIQKGEQIGIQKGEQIGIQKGKIEVVIALHDDGISVNHIAKYTNLAEDEVIKILGSNPNITRI